MPQLFDHQIAGAQFLASRQAALLADEQRVGKTAAAITACDYVMAENILVVTTASARAQWAREFREWGLPRETRVIFSAKERVPEGGVVIVAWTMVAELREKLAARRWDVLLLDESHAAKNPGAKRTIAVFNTDPAAPEGLYASADHVWCLSGTPVPNSPADLWPTLRALAPTRLMYYVPSDNGTPFEYDRFVERYCTYKMRHFNGAWTKVIKGGKNLDELNERVKGFWLRRTQQDVGIRAPIYSTFALTVDKLPPELRDSEDAQLVFDAMETGETETLEMHLGPIRRLTGHMKAHAVVAAATEMLEEGGLDKLVLMAWHTDVIDILYTGLARFNPVGIDGRTPAARRDVTARVFQQRADTRVFIGQIQAAGEAIDLSAAAELWFVEPSFVPKDMSQAAMRITNHSQKRQALVRVCALAGSIDEALMTILTRKVATIRTIMENQ